MPQFTDFNKGSQLLIKSCTKKMTAISQIEVSKAGSRQSKVQLNYFIKVMYVKMPPSKVRSAASKTSWSTYGPGHLDF